MIAAFQLMPRDPVPVGTVQRHQPALLAEFDRNENCATMAGGGRVYGRCLHLTLRWFECGNPNLSEKPRSPPHGIYGTGSHSMTPTPFDLTGRVAIVTGGNGGIGLGMARGLAEAGTAVAIVGRNAAKSDAVDAELTQRGAKAISVVTDVTDRTAVAAMVERTKTEFGRIDVLINNAGINVRKPPHALRLEEWDSVIKTN